MNADLAAALDEHLAATMGFLGVPATFTAQGAAAVACAVLMQELPDEVVQQRHGHDRARLADCQVRRALVADARHGDGLLIEDGPSAGRWTVLGVERRDAVSLLLRVRFDTPVDAAAPGAREVRR